MTQFRLQKNGHITISVVKIITIWTYHNVTDLKKQLSQHWGPHYWETDVKKKHRCRKMPLTGMISHEERNVGK